ncbi:MAG TPA: TIM barrel protein [Limnochordia bacterium]|nr:TIM barrel protein [Limnochordia bacterium]
MAGLRIGTAGIPASTKPQTTPKGIVRLAELGLEHMEIEFVRGVRMSEKTAADIKELAQEQGISLTVHAPYYINLNSKEPEKVEASKERILKSARIGAAAGATSVTFHAAFYHDDDPEQVYQVVKRHMEEMLEELERSRVKIRLSPETTGGPTQFGTLEELIRLGQELPGVYPCVDFAHLYARSLGEFNSYEHFAGALRSIRDNLGPEALQALHIHLSGIEHGPRGEKRHLPLAETELNYRAVLQALADFRVQGYLTCESPILEEDALILKGLYAELDQE